MNIGLHLVVYQAEEFVDKFLEPWLAYKISGGKVKISVGHCCFKENFDQGLPIKSVDKTHELFQHHLRQQHIDYYQFLNEPMSEMEARDKVFEPINNVDYLWLAAPDEIYTINEIKQTVRYIEKEPFMNTFRIEFKNLVFTEKKYVKGFRPTRIFKNKEFKIHRFRGDDEVNFIGENGVITDYTHLAQKQIPVNICNPLHYTWLNNERSKQKVKYQEKRWNPPNGYGCSFAWDDANNCLVWNQDYFKVTGQPIPILYNV